MNRPQLGYAAVLVGCSFALALTVMLLDWLPEGSGTTTTLGSIAVLTIIAALFLHLAAKRTLRRRDGA